MFIELRYWHRVKAYQAHVGFVMQDVVADTMSTEVIDKSQSKEEIHCM
jgi:hypothetical protein